MRSLALATAKAGNAIVDATGFDGWAVCGNFFLAQLKAHHPDSVRACSAPCVEQLYRFGGGTARALSCVEIAMCTPSKSAVRKQWAQVDVVGGSLPMLIGRGLGSHLGLVIDVSPGTVLVKEADAWLVAAQNDPTGLIFLSLIGQVDVRSGTVVPDEYKRNFYAAKTAMAGAIATDDAGASTGDERSCGDAGSETGEVEVDRADNVACSRDADGVRDQASDVAESHGEASAGASVVASGAADGPAAAAAQGATARYSTPQSEADSVEFASTVRKVVNDTQSDRRANEPPPARNRTQTGGRASVVPPEKSLPRILRMSDAQILRLHSAGHRSTATIMKFIRSAVGAKRTEKFAIELRALESRVQEVEEKCPGCYAREAKSAHKTVVPVVTREPMNRAFLDVLKVSDSMYALGIVDEATDDCCLQCLPGGHSSVAIVDGLFERWTSLRGRTEFIVSDRAPELLTELAVSSCEALGIVFEKTPAFASDSHGRIERKFGTIRRSLARLQDCPECPTNEREWRHAILSIENDCRNVVTVGGWSSAQRAWGRGTSIHASLDEQNLAQLSGSATTQVQRLCEVREAARLAFQHERCSKAAGRILSERARATERAFVVGEAVYFRRPVEKGSNTTHFVGPGVVSAVVHSLDEQSSGLSYTISRGGNLYSVHPADLKGALEYRVGDNRPLVLETSLTEDVERGYKTTEPTAPQDPTTTKTPVIILAEDEEQSRIDSVVRKLRSVPVKRRGRPPGSKNKQTTTKTAKGVAKTVAKRPAKRVARTVRKAVRPGAKTANAAAARKSRAATPKRKPRRVLAGHVVQPSIARLAHRICESHSIGFVTPVKTCDAVDGFDALCAVEGARPGTTGTAGTALEATDAPGRQGRSTPESPEGGAEGATESEGSSPELRSLWEDEEAWSDEGPEGAPESEDAPDCVRDRDRNRKEECVSERVCVNASKRGMFLRAFLASAETAVATNEVGALNAELPLGCEVVGQDTQYAHQWSDVSHVEQQAAMRKGISDYDVAEAWSADGLTWNEVRWQDPDAVKLTAHWVRKAKLVRKTLNGTEQWVLVGRARWTPHGYLETWLGKADCESPTTSVVAIRLSAAIGMKYGMFRFHIDLESAFFSSDPRPDEDLHTWIMEPSEAQPVGYSGPARYRKLLKSAPGTRQGPRAFWETLKAHLLADENMVQSRVDQCTFYRIDESSGLNLFTSWHVDDAEGWASTVQVAEEFVASLRKRFGVKYRLIPRGEPAIFAGVESLEDTDGMTYTQHAYNAEKLKPITVEAKADQVISEHEREALNTGVGCLRWGQRTCLEYGYDLHRLATWKVLSLACGRWRSLRGNCAVVM